MQKKSVVINVPEITNRIRSEHKKFMKDVGVFSHKISEDHQLLITRLAARISRVLECFVEEEIIDEIIPLGPPYLDNEYIRAFKLKKKGFDVSVYIETDGKSITFTDSNLKNKINRDCSLEVVDLDAFDGSDFAWTLLNYIHQKIYSRQQSYEDSIFKSR